MLTKVINKGSYAIDATAGNGKDTLFLAQLVGETGKVFAFDIQEKALEKTGNLLLDHGLRDRVSLICQGHEAMDYYVDQKVQGVIFNLGYLPGGDRRIVTFPHTTICALQKSTQLLAEGGVLAIAVYWEHSGGMEEREAVEDWVSKLTPSEWDVIKLTFPNKKYAPYVIGVQKKLLEAK